MPRSETILSVFVASPSDVEEERNRLEEVIRELNTTWARDLGIRLELVRWETHAFPGFGEDPQAVINEQIPDDFDIFVGLMWYRFGTPTGRAGSGTIEEFERAKTRFDRKTDDLKLMIYFKDAPAPIAPSKLDYGQLAKVAEFRSSLGNEGGLYWAFKTTDEFEKLIRLHLTRRVQGWLTTNSQTRGDETQPQIETENKPKQQLPDDSFDDDGFLDLMERFEDEFETLMGIMERISSATVDIGEEMTERATEITEFSAGPDAKDRKAAKRIIAKAAADMDQFVHRMESELPLFSQHLNSGMNAMTKAAEISLEFKLDDQGIQQAKSNLAATAEFRETMYTVEGQVAGFQQSVASLPRMTSVLNRSKRAMVNVLGKLIAEFQSAQTLAREVEASFTSIVKSET
ncbi:MAG: DUF4062 domain-containing protein [Nannocystis sp.]|nr:DUF4062 domain-containing protein [Nannocystis sp.]